MHIDTATAADIPALSELLSLLFTQEAEFTPDPAAQARGLARIIDNPEAGSVLVARQDNLLVGMVNLLYTISTALGEMVALLEDLVVAPNARGAGVGSQLLAQAIAVARAGGCRRITLLTDRSNEAAQRLYSKHGFGASTMMPMRLLLN
jgi:ribosomal protein S18 acetylase RimI-like enzyme